MRTGKQVLLYLIVILTVFSFITCKKKRAFKNEDGQVTVDNRMTQGETDEAVKDVNIVIMEQYLLRGKSSNTVSTIFTGTTSICDAILDTSLRDKGIVKLNFSGKECYGRKRTGAIRITLTNYPLKKWKNVGCIAKLDYMEYEVTRTNDGRRIKIEGTQLLTNNSGGTWFDLWFLNQPSVIYTLTGEDLSITYDGNNTAIYNFNRQMTYTYSGEITKCSIRGLASEGGHSDVENWGQGRDGAFFTAQVASPVIWKTKCGAMAPVSGEVILRVSGKEFDMKCKLGTDKNGNAVGEDPSECPYGYEMSWSYKRKTNIRVFGYY
jgi:hypothetical protein